MKNLIIVESPNKVKSIEHYLGNDYQAIASVGHIFKLPASGPERLGIDTVIWKPLWKIDENKKKVIEDIKLAMKDKDIIYIATDPDREGEAIADNLVHALHIANNYRRIRFNEITQDAIKYAIDKANNNPKKAIIDDALVHAQMTRRMLDRIIGFKLSTLMRKKLSGYPLAPSAGRVQSIALKLVVDREKLITDFVPKKYFTISAIIKNEVIVNYIDPAKKENKNWVFEKDIKKIFSSLKGDLEVTNINKTKHKEKKYVPLKQSQLYSLSESKLQISSIKTQFAAQKLYEGYGKGGLISYPRTDSNRFSNNFIKKAKAFISKKYGIKYFDENVKGHAGNQDAHESIRPTSFDMTPNKAKEMFNLEDTQFKIYSLIYYHSLKCLMTQPERTNYTYIVTNNNHEFRLSTFTIDFIGYYKISSPPIPPNIPKLNVGDKVPVLKYEKTAKETKPPARYTGGSLIYKLDEIGVGRPSTFATTIKINLDRLYFEKVDHALVPTQFGKIVLGKLLEHFPDIINEKYTAIVEEELDKIADNKHDYKRTMTEFYKKFGDELDTAYKTMDFEKIPLQNTGDKCPDSGHDLVYRISKRGDKFIACSGFPECRYTKSMPNQKRRWKFFKKKTK